MIFLFLWLISSQTTLFVSANVRGDYYNNRLEVWEPMVESWSFVVNVCQSTVIFFFKASHYSLVPLF